MSAVYLVFQKKLGRLMGVFASEEAAARRIMRLQEAQQLLREEVTEFVFQGWDVQEEP